MVCTVVSWIQALRESYYQFSAVVLDICFKKCYAHVYLQNIYMEISGSVRINSFFEFEFLGHIYYYLFYVIYVTKCIIYHI